MKRIILSHRIRLTVGKGFRFFHFHLVFCFIIRKFLVPCSYARDLNIPLVLNMTPRNKKTLLPFFLRKERVLACHPKKKSFNKGQK